jgi:SAM-dependent methyltransferase
MWQMSSVRVTVGAHPHYEQLVLDAIPIGCKRALDVGCGNGFLTRALRERGIPEVTGLDRDRACLEWCRAHPEAGGINFVEADVLTAPLEPGSFDLVSSIGCLHHMDARAGLTRLRDLVAPGGVLAIVGMARPDWPKDLPLAALTFAVGRVRPKRTGNMPKFPVVWPPPERFPAMRRLAEEILPGAQWRRQLMYRYSLIWSRPG